MRVWGVESGRQVGEALTGHESWVSSVAMNGEGTRVVSASIDLDLESGIFYFN